VVDFSAVDSVTALDRDRVDTDALLARLEDRMARDAGGQASAVQRMAQDGRQSWVLEHLTDHATGLFCAEFASFKLDEEFKRATRFHQALSLILLDLGRGLPAATEARDRLLAEAAGVFLVALRDIDVLARFSDTAFLFLLPGTGAAGAAVVAQRLLLELRERAFSGGFRLDPHAGLATAPAAGIADRGALLARAEACLGLARQGQGTGRLCVSCE
jgi:GGDEF domain-containing protein